MIKVKKGMKALVVGLARSGVSATKLMCKKGIKVTITDEKNKSDLKDSLDALKGFDFDAELGKHVLKTFCEQDFIVVSPGVRMDIKPLQQAQKLGIPIISEIELASQFISEPIIAITGHEELQARVHDCQGLYGIFKKPWNDRELLKRVATVAQLRGATTGG